jgi:hypothetical protein
MNERIQELMLLAGTDTSGKWMGVEHAEKFAELIVKECAEVASKVVVEHEGVDFGLVEACYKHFGVEE